jgi:putative transposase
MWEQTMPGRKHGHEEIVAKLRHVEDIIGQGRSLADAIATIGVAEATYYRWRKELGTLSVDQMQRLKELEVENSRLRQAVLDLTIDKITLMQTLKGL